jgi:uncharacterized protein YkuJ
MSLGTVFPTSMPDLNSPFDLTRLKIRQQSALQGFRLPVLRNYSNANKKLERVAERLDNAKLYDNEHILKLTSYSSSETYDNDFVDVPIEQNKELLENVKKAGAAEDDASVVSEALSDDEENDPPEYVAAKAEIRKAVSKVKGLRKRHGDTMKVIERLEKKQEDGGSLTEREKALLKQAQEETINTYVKAAKAVPKAQAGLKAYRKSNVREVLKRHLVPIVGGGADDSKEAKAAQTIQRFLMGERSSLRLGLNDRLWYRKKLVNPTTLNLKDATRINDVILKRYGLLDLSSPEGRAEYDVLNKHRKDIQARISNLTDDKGVKAKPKGGKGATSAAAEAASAAPSRSVSRAVSPAPPETEAEDEGGGDGRPKSIKIKRATSGTGSAAAAAEKKVVKVDDKLFMNTVGTAKEVYLSGKKMTTTEELEEVLDLYAGNKSEEALAVIKYIKSKLKRL